MPLGGVASGVKKPVNVNGACRNCALDASPGAVRVGAEIVHDMDALGLTLLISTLYVFPSSVAVPLNAPSSVAATEIISPGVHGVHDANASTAPSSGSALPLKLNPLVPALSMGALAASGGTFMDPPVILTGSQNACAAIAALSA